MEFKISERAAVLAAISATEIKPRCESFCTLLLVQRTDVRRVWRCEKCLRYIESLISKEHERAESKRAREALPDQITIYDLLEES